MSRMYMVEILITEPKGASLDDWGYIGKSFVDLPENATEVDYKALRDEAAKLIAAYERRTRDDLTSSPAGTSPVNGHGQQSLPKN